MFTSSCASHLGYQVPLLKYTLFLLFRTGLLTGMPRRHQDTWSKPSPSWYQKNWKSSTSEGDKTSDGNAGCTQRDTRGTSSSGHADNTETWEETKEKFMNITPEELRRLQKILSNEKGSLSQTHKKNTEANAKIYDPSWKAMQPLETLAAVCAVFEKAGENRNVENSEGDVLHADGRAAIEEFNRAQHNQ